MPIGKYPDFKTCKSAKMKEGLSSDQADKYCGALYWATHGKKEGTEKLKHEIEEAKKQLIS